MTNERAMAGPAFSAAAVPVSTKNPAPMIAPMPRVTRFIAVSVRFSPPCSSLASASALSASIDLRTHMLAIRSGPRFEGGWGTGRVGASPGLACRRPASLRVGEFHHLDLADLHHAPRVVLLEG